MSGFHDRLAQDHGAHLPGSDDPEKPPAEPGYAAHPELAHPPGHRPGAPPSGQARGTAAAHQHAAHDKHAGHTVAMFRDRFWLTLALTVPTLLWSHELQQWFAYTAPRVPGAAYIPPVFGTAVYLYGGSPFMRGAV